jgi:hypothetical protein
VKTCIANLVQAIANDRQNLYRGMPLSHGRHTARGGINIRSEPPPVTAV